MLTQPIGVCFADLMMSCIMSETLPDSFLKDLLVKHVLVVFIHFCLLMPENLSLLASFVPFPEAN